jgi:hypothetical protein
MLWGVRLALSADSGDPHSGAQLSVQMTAEPERYLATFSRCWPDYLCVSCLQNRWGVVLFADGF